MTVALKKLTPNLMVEDANETVNFYQDVLGFALVASVPEEGQFNWAMMQHDAVEIMFQSRASLTEDVPLFKDKAIGGSLTLYIDVEDIKGLYGQVQNRVTILHEMTTTFYGTREFTIQDCNRYVLTFAQAEKEAS